ncbi:hypothetical protein [Parasphingorhabdus sp.]
MQAWLPVQLNKIPAKSALAGAIRYAVTRLKRLEVYSSIMGPALTLET